MSLPTEAESAWEGHPPHIDGADRLTYKSIDDIDLHLWVITPETAAPMRPAVVFFFGGGWRQGSPSQFVAQAEQLAARGVVAILADYRVSARHGTKIVDAISDARSAVRWVRENAARWQIDPDRIAASGGSAGGHLAATTATIDQFDASSDNLDVGATPNALVLFNPAVTLAPYPGGPTGGADQQARLRDRAGAELEDVSPAHRLTTDLPPTLVMHGRADRVVPYASAEYYCDAVREAGGQCRLVGYAGETHGFFNYARSRSMFDATMQEVDRFLVELGWIEAPE